MRRTLIALPAALLALTGCAAEKPAPAAVTSSASPTASPSPTEPRPKRMGDTWTVVRDHDQARLLTVTAYAYKQPVPATNPPPQAGFVWAGLDAKICALPDAEGGATAVRDAWRLLYPDGTRAEPSGEGWGDFPKPEFPWATETLATGRCARGWIVYPVRRKIRPTTVEWSPRVASGPAPSMLWRVS